ncbi:hypothetical protein [Dactylosporangium sp. NPDC050588]|uniref:hypothetical protein n=1 Tax=Dactylosporangium sp. NPDC050588 TaxID=3157211 RepID=UPI0033BFFAF8
MGTVVFASYLIGLRDGLEAALVIAGTVNLTPRASVLEITAWLLFAGVMLALFFRPAPRTAVVARP